MSLLRLRVPPGKLLASIKPYKKILSACVRDGSIGFALSDLYFSTSAPLAPLQLDAPPGTLRAGASGDRRWWSALLRDHDVGATVFALPVGLAGAAAVSAAAQRADLIRALESPERAAEAAPSFGDDGSGVFAELAESVPLAAARALAHETPELWEGVAPFLHSAAAERVGGMSDGECAAHAAISLNSFLWVECEGWSRNTFG